MANIAIFSKIIPEKQPKIAPFHFSNEILTIYDNSLYRLQPKKRHFGRFCTVYTTLTVCKTLNGHLNGTPICLCLAVLVNNM